MTAATAALIVGAAATVLTCVLLVPQIARLLKTRQTEGVSPGWAVLGVVVNSGWLIFLAAEAVWLPILSCAIAEVGFILTVWLLRRNGADVRAGVGAGAGAAVIVAAIGAGWGWTALGAALALATMVQFLPSIVAAWRTYAPVGLSPATWTLTLAETVGWMAYGVLIDEIPIILYGLTGIAASVLILARIAMTRSRIRAVAGDGYTGPLI